MLPRGPSLGDGLWALLCQLPRRLNTASSTPKPMALLQRHPSGRCNSRTHTVFPSSFLAPSCGTLLRPSRPYSSSRHGHTHVPPPPHSQRDLYSILGVSYKATQQQIKDQYYQLSMLYHPDRNKGSQEAHQRFSEITEAYSILGQHTLRRKYDKGLLQEYPRKPHADDTHTHRDYHPETAMSKGMKKIYDFDEFYRAHYKDALQWQREQVANRRAAAAEAKRLQNMSEPMQRLLIAVVVLAVFLVGWLLAKQQRKEQDKLERWT